MKILFLSISAPLPPTNGQQLRNAALLQTLHAVGHAVSLVCFGEPRDEAPMRAICSEVHTVETSPAARTATRDYAGRLRALFSPLPYGVQRFCSRQMRDRITSLLAAGGYEALLCDDIYLIRNIPDVSIPVLLNKHDITSVIVRRFLQHSRQPAKVAYGWTEWYKLRRWEILQCSRAASVLVCSEHDRELLRAAGVNTPMHVLPNVIDVDKYVATPQDGGDTILFTGAMDWLPNLDAVEFFASKILPRIRAVRPEVRFVVAGRAPAEKLRERLHREQAVEFTGWVPDMQPFLSAAAVCVVPLRIGSGTRLKILEAAATERPVVSTTIGAEGLAFQNGREIVLADEPEAFARAVLELLADPARRRSMGRAARLRVQRRYSLAALQDAVRRALLPWDTSADASAVPETAVMAQEGIR